MQQQNSAPPDFILPLTANAPAGQNGRVAFSATDFSDRNAGVPGFESQTTVEADFQADMLRGNWEVTPISTAFFSVENVRASSNSSVRGCMTGAIRRDTLLTTSPRMN